MNLPKLRRAATPVLLTLALALFLSACDAHTRNFRGHHGQFHGHQGDHRR